MRDYCGINGCYEFRESDDEEQEVLCIYLNSPVVYEDFDGEFIRTTAENRSWPDVEFTVEDVSLDEENGKEEAVITSMKVDGLGMDGVNEFVSALLQQDINDKDNLVFAVKKLLDKNGAIWGIVKTDELDD